MRYTQNKLYEIKWRDHFSTEGFFDRENPDVVKEVILASVGYFIKQDNKYVHFARTMGKETYADIMSIMKEQIVSVGEL